MKLLFTTLATLIFLITLNSVFFEYCISRPFNIYLTTALGVLLFALNSLLIYGLIKAFVNEDERLNAKKPTTKKKVAAKNTIKKKPIKKK